jgi:hypothetical protein
MYYAGIDYHKRYEKKGVIHIGFLSSKKTLSPDRKSSCLSQSSARSFGLLLSGAVLPRDIERTETSWSHRSVSHLRVLLDSFVESTGPEAGSSFVQSSIRI